MTLDDVNQSLNKLLSEPHLNKQVKEKLDLTLKALEMKKLGFAINHLEYLVVEDCFRSEPSNTTIRNALDFLKKHPEAFSHVDCQP